MSIDRHVDGYARIIFIADKHVYTIVNGYTKEEYVIIRFQNGAEEKYGVNGITVENLLHICKQKLKYEKADTYGCADTEMALMGIEAAMAALNQRTQRRLNRNVERNSEE